MAQKIKVIQIQGQISPATVLGDLLTCQIPATLIPTLAPSPLGSHPPYGLCPAARRPHSPSGEEKEVHQPRDDGGEQTPILEDLGQKGKKETALLGIVQMGKSCLLGGLLPQLPILQQFPSSAPTLEVYTNSRW